MDEIIKDYIKKEFMFDNPQAVLENDESLVQGGIVDSLGIFLLIEFVDRQFGIKVQPEDVVVENFETVNSIMSLVNAKKVAAAQPASGS